MFAHLFIFKQLIIYIYGRLPKKNMCNVLIINNNLSSHITSCKHHANITHLKICIPLFQNKDVNKQLSHNMSSITYHRNKPQNLQTFEHVKNTMCNKTP
jgi:hypothetical protein